MSPNQKMEDLYLRKVCRRYLTEDMAFQEEGDDEEAVVELSPEMKAKRVLRIIKRTAARIMGLKDTFNALKENLKDSEKMESLIGLNKIALEMVEHLKIISGTANDMLNDISSHIEKPSMDTTVNIEKPIVEPSTNEV